MSEKTINRVSDGSMFSIDESFDHESDCTQNVPIARAIFQNNLFDETEFRQKWTSYIERCEL